MTKTLANGYSSESAQRKLFNECPHDRVQMFFKTFCVFCALDKSSLSSGMANPFMSGDLNMCFLDQSYHLKQMKYWNQAEIHKIYKGGL